MFREHVGSLSEHGLSHAFQEVHARAVDHLTELGHILCDQTFFLLKVLQLLDSLNVLTEK